MSDGRFAIPTDRVDARPTTSNEHRICQRPRYSTACVADTANYPKPFELPCHPYSGFGDKPAEGLLNLLLYVAQGESEATAAASGECAAVLAESDSDTLGGSPLQEAIKSLNDAVVVGYPDIQARLQTLTDLLTAKAEVVGRVLATC